MNNQNDVINLTIEDFALLFGTTVGDISQHCGDLVQNGDFRYERIEEALREQLILQVLKKLFSPDLARAGEERQQDWEEGWRENLSEFLASGYDLDRLIPKYFKKNVPARLNLEYIMPISPNFVFAYTHVYRTWIFQRYFKEVENIYEFGCGPAYHLAYLAQLYPDKRIFGLDWATSSQEIIRHLAKHFKWNIEGRRFDFFKPDPNFFLEKNSGILTFGALEQVGENHGPFLKFLLKNRPSICVNVECLHELYDRNNLLSYLALQYHQKRNYLSGYLTKLQRLEQEKQVEIIKFHHHRFGNLFDDALSYVIWRPKRII
jgi:SAM-dependent methyltransferase